MSDKKQNKTNLNGLQDSSNWGPRLKFLWDQKVTDFYSQENSSQLQEQMRQQEMTIKQQESKITELESLLAAAYDELEEKDEVILELYTKYQQLQQLIKNQKQEKKLNQDK